MRQRIDTFRQRIDTFKNQKGWMGSLAVKRLGIRRIILFLSLWMVVTGMLISCDKDLHDRHAGETLYYSFNNEQVIFTNDLGISSYTTDYPEIAQSAQSAQGSASTGTYIFLRQHRSDIYYYSQLEFDFKDYDDRLFIILSDASTSGSGYQIGFTNSDFTNNNITIYYYKIMGNYLSVTNDGHLYFTNTGILPEGSWQVRGNITNQGLDISIDQSFQMATFNGSNIVSE